MSILIGIKSDSASGSFYGAEGFQGFSIEADKIIIIDEGDREYLLKKYDEISKRKKEYNKKSNDLEERGENGLISYNTLCRMEDDLAEEYRDDIPYFGCKTLLIVEGDILPF